ncbi:MAG: DUF3231 family protein [Tumebacillaceae bacterium]
MNIPFIASEIACLWQLYMQETMSQCCLRYFANCTDDEEIRAIINAMLESVNEAIQTMRAFFVNENLPVPVGFTEQDVDVNAPKLFFDPFMIHFVSFMTHVGTQSACSALTVVARADLRQFFIKRLEDTLRIENRIFDVLLGKGLFAKSPTVTVPSQVEFSQGQNFVGELLGNHRPLNVVEVNHLFINSLRNAQGMEMLTGFAQTVRAEDIRAYILEGKDMSKKFMEMFNSHMVAEDLVPSTLPGVGVTMSTVPPFSDKLMLNLVAALDVYAISVYGTSMAQSSRSDLGVLYARVVAETGTYALEGSKLLVKYGYLESPPELPDRGKLAEE